jgi:WXG100 family type VII secretion target
MGIKIEPEDLETEETNMRDVIGDFTALLDARKTAIENLDWEGDAPAAFQTMFETAKTNFETHVEENITNIADALKAIKEGMEEQDSLTAGTIDGMIA